MQRLTDARLWSALLFSFVLSACGGGGGGGAVGGGPPVVLSPSPSPITQGSLTFSVGGASATINVKRRGQWIPAKMSSLQGTLSTTISPVKVVAQQTVACATSSTCSVTLTAPNGSYNLDISAVDSYGAPLSHIRIPVTVSPGTQTIHGTLNGVVSKFTFVLASPLPMNGSPTSTQLLVTAYDYDNDVIMTPGNYDTPIQLGATNTNPAAGSSALTISETTINGPQDVVTVKYDGKSYTSLVLTGSDDHGPKRLNIAPQLQAHEYVTTSQAPMLSTLALGADGNIWTGTYDSVVRVTPSGTLTEFCANPGPSMVAAGGDGRIWFTADGTHAPAPGVVTCPASGIGVHAITTSGTQAVVPTTEVNTSMSRLNGPISAPDGSVWALVSTISSPNYLVHFDASGNELAPIQPTINGSIFGGIEMPSLAPDGSFWYASDDAVIRCPASGICTLHQDNIYYDGAVPDGAGNMLATDSFNSAIDDLDVNFNVRWKVSVPSDALLATPPVLHNGAIWIPAMTSAFSTDELPQILWAATNGSGYAYLQLPDGSSNAVGNPTPDVKGIMFAPDGRLWYTRDSKIGVTPVQ